MYCDSFSNRSSRRWAFAGHATAVVAAVLLLAACGEQDAQVSETPEPLVEEQVTTVAAPARDEQDHDHDHAHGHDHDHAHAHRNGEAPAPPAEGDAYPLAVCPVSGMELGSMGMPIVYEHEGRQIRFCCDECIEPFEEAPAEHLAEVDERIVEDQLAHYPMDTCVVSGAELGSMGDPVNYVYGNRLVRFCCPMCDETFEADPAAHLAQIDAAAIEQQKADYPTDMCVVSGEPLSEWGEPVDIVMANRLVRLCCNTCAEDFHADPAGYLAKRDGGRVPATPAVDHDHHHGDHEHDHAPDH